MTQYNTTQSKLSLCVNISPLFARGLLARSRVDPFSTLAICIKKSANKGNKYR